MPEYKSLNADMDGRDSCAGERGVSRRHNQCFAVLQSGFSISVSDEAEGNSFGYLTDGLFW